MQVTPKRNWAIVTVAIGSDCMRLLEISAPLMEQYASKHKADFIPITDKTQQWAPLEKFRCRELLQYYRRILFLDVDTIINPKSPPIPRTPIRTAMHDDYYLLHSTKWLLDEWRLLAESQGVNPIWHGWCYNSGVILCHAKDAKLFTPPVEPFKPTHCAEQLWIEYNATQHRIMLGTLSRQWNNQWWMDGFSDHVGTSYINHWANCPNRAIEMREHVQSITEAERIAWIERWARPEDRGVGDTVERLLSIVGADKIKSIIARLGMDCGCSNRRDWLNRRWPYRNGRV